MCTKSGHDVAWTFFIVEVGWRSSDKMRNRSKASSKTEVFSLQNGYKVRLPEVKKTFGIMYSLLLLAAPVLKNTGKEFLKQYSSDSN